ncbi:hypothetical protein B0T09DRAFT_35761 [Sordaria sp. MPI-SDFR-AT-0083]|nr:hypothetical protein B0T09DRAFT_35761 [Sordaria sp. MPI-SDFR-AT-0083]
MDSFKAGDIIESGSSIKSKNGKYELVFQDDGNFVLYEVSHKRPLWSSNTTSSYRKASKGLLQDDGNLRLFDDDNGEVWSSHTGGRGDASTVLTVQDDGNVRLMSGENQLWATNTAQKEPEKPANPEVGAKDRLTAGEELTKDQRRSSPSGEYTLIMQADNNLVLYKKDKGPIWARGKTAGNSAEKLVFRGDGELELLTWSGAQKWVTGTAGRGNSDSFFAVRDDGNMVISTDGQIVWSSKTGPELPEAKRDRLKGGQRLLAGEALTSPNGRFTLTFQNDGNFVLYEGSEPRWASGGHSYGQGGGWLLLTTDGNMTSFEDDQSSQWSSRTRYRRTGGDCELIIQDNGAAVLKLDGVTTWAVNGGSATTYEPRDFSPVTSGDKISPGQYLAAGQSITSNNGDMIATLDENGQFVVRYTKTGDSIIVSTNPRKETATKLTVGYNDDVILWGENGTKIWQASNNIDKYAMHYDDDDRERFFSRERNGGLILSNNGKLRLYGSGWPNDLIWTSGRSFAGFSGKRISQLKPGEILVIGQNLLSDNGDHELSLLPSGNLRIRNTRFNTSVYYFTNDDTRLTDAHYLEFGQDHVLEVRGETNGMIWRSSNRKYEPPQRREGDRHDSGSRRIDPPRFILDNRASAYINAVDYQYRADYNAWRITDLESCLTPVKPTSFGDTLRPNFTMKPEHILTSNSGEYMAKFNNKGEFALICNTDNSHGSARRGDIMWRAKGAASSNSVWVTGDGNLCVGDEEKQKVKWQSETAGSGTEPRLVVQDDGNMCLYAGGKCAWHSNTAGGWRRDYDY